MSDENIKLTEKWGLDERRTTLRRFRKENKLSAAKLGEMAGLAESTITRFERGDRDLSEDAMRRVTEAITEVSADRRLKAHEEERRKAEIEKKLVRPLRDLLKATPENLPDAELSMETKLVPLSALSGASYAERQKSSRLADADQLKQLDQRIAETLAETANLDLKLSGIWTEILGEMLLGKFTRGEVRELLENIGEDNPGRQGRTAELDAQADALTLISDHIKIVLEEIASAKAARTTKAIGKVNA